MFDSCDGRAETGDQDAPQGAALGTTLDGDLPVGAARDELAALAERSTTFSLASGPSFATREADDLRRAHELRTPLASLTTQLELAPTTRATRQRCPEHLRGRSHRWRAWPRLATNLLELNRLESDAGSQRDATGRAHDELMGAIVRARMLGVARSIEIASPSRIPMSRASHWMPGRSANARQPPGQWAVNAVDAGGSIDVELVLAVPDVVLTVQDDGPGMPTIFSTSVRRFSRRDDARSAQSGAAAWGRSRAGARRLGGWDRARADRARGLEVEVPSAQDVRSHTRRPFLHGRPIASAQKRSHGLRPAFADAPVRDVRDAPDRPAAASTRGGLGLPISVDDGLGRGPGSSHSSMDGVGRQPPAAVADRRSEARAAARTGSAVDPGRPDVAHGKRAARLV